MLTETAPVGQRVIEAVLDDGTVMVQNGQTAESSNHPEGHAGHDNQGVEVRLEQPAHQQVRNQPRHDQEGQRRPQRKLGLRPARRDLQVRKQRRKGIKKCTVKLRKKRN